MACVNDAAMAADTLDREKVDISPAALQARFSQDFVDFFLDALVRAIDLRPIEAVGSYRLLVLNKDDYSFCRLPSYSEDQAIQDYVRSKGWLSATIRRNDNGDMIVATMSCADRA